MLQAIAIAITCFICFAFDNLTERFIRLVLEILGEIFSIRLPNQ